MDETPRLRALRSRTAPSLLVTVAGESRCRACSELFATPLHLALSQGRDLHGHELLAAELEDTECETCRLGHGGTSR